MKQDSCDHDLSALLVYYTMGVFKSDRSGFTKMRVTALIIVRLL